MNFEYLNKKSRTLFVTKKQEEKTPERTFHT
jgi:hypothetical protein